VLTLLLLAPAVPELLTGSTPITRLAVDPVGFFVGFGLDVALYGTAALLLRELAVALRKGWGTILLWGAAYGIGEEGFAVHTFFERSGPPVGALTVYGSAWGVNWLWALGLTIFHATYSIALPILLVRLAFPRARAERWLDPGALVLLAAVYLADVVLLSSAVRDPPGPLQFAFFLTVAGVLLAAGALLPRDLLRPRQGRSRLGPWGVGVAGALGWSGWLTVLLLAGTRAFSAWVAAGTLLAFDAVALAVVLTAVGTDHLERDEVRFAAGMLIPLFLWDVLLEAAIPGLVVVGAIAAYLLYRLAREVDRRDPIPRETPGAPGAA